jgi:hypothetical protein
VALEKVARSSPVGRPPKFCIGKREARKWATPKLVTLDFYTTVYTTEVSRTRKDIRRQELLEHVRYAVHRERQAGPRPRS